MRHARMKNEWHKWHTSTENSPFQTLKTIAKRSMAQLQVWSREEFGDRDKKLKELIGKLKHAKENNIQYERGNEIINIER